MKRVSALAAVLCLLAGFAAPAGAQAPEPAGGDLPGYTSIYCSGFMTTRNIQEGLHVLAGERGVATEFIPGDVVFLSRGAGWIVSPGGEYIVYRRTVDIDRTEMFPGQNEMLAQMGTMYVEIGRLKIAVVNEHSSSAVVTHTCESISPGDIAVPFNVKPAPVIRPVAELDRFTPPSGKQVGMIATGRNFQLSFAEREIGFLNIGATQGIQVGQYVRVWRPFENSAGDRLDQYMRRGPRKIRGQRLGIELTREQERALPREILGEAVVMHVEPGSATVLFTNVQRPIFAGDRVEVE